MDPKRQDDKSQKNAADSTIKDLPEQDKTSTENEQDENVKGGMLPPHRRAALE